MSFKENELKLSLEIPNVIAAFTEEKRGIGFKNDLPWKRALSTDLKWLNYLTTESDKKVALIMGRNTYESIGRPLPKRENIVVSSTKFDKVINVSNIQEALTYTKEKDLIPVFFGGTKIFEEALKLNCKVFFTIIKENQSLFCDTFFPNYDINLKNITNEVINIFKQKHELKILIKNEKIIENGIEFSFFCGENKIK